nr:MAG TPA: hypothetical protein [Caudoviricetes sp.]
MILYNSLVLKINRLKGATNDLRRIQRKQRFTIQ